MKIPEIIKKDTYLKPFTDKIISRIEFAEQKEKELSGNGTLSDFANAHNFYGLHRREKFWIYCDRLPGAEKVFIIGDFSDWQICDKFRLIPQSNGNFELKFSLETLRHGDLYRLFVVWNTGSGNRIPAYAKRVVQDANTNIFNAQVWYPPKIYKQKYKSPPAKKSVLIYEAHIGMSSEEEKVSSFNEFRENILPKIIKSGYDTIQLMAIQEHPYYGSFGYHVSNFFAVSSRFGTPDDLKKLIDEIHKNDLRVIMDLVHSHAVKNEVEGLGKYDGTDYQYFHSGKRGLHTAWDSLCFDYGKNEVLHFLLSNCKFWIEEYNFDGFRFDGVTSMLYLNHGLETDFVSYEQYFDENTDKDAITYLMLANKLIHKIKPDAITVAEEMSGMPGIASSLKSGGYGFDYRLAMGIPDFWIKLLKEISDENWHVGDIFHRLTDKRIDEKVVNYSESHDQALVGDKTIMFRLADKEMYYSMQKNSTNFKIQRAVALHKLIRLITISTGGGGYLNFMGNEFGHPEWIDFPREGNNWSHRYACRQWNLAENPELAYFYLRKFDIDMIKLIKENEILTKEKAVPLVQNNYDMVLIFKRGNLFFIFNFNPILSFSDYGFETEKGNYKIIFNSDSSEYLGHNRIDNKMIYETIENKEAKKHFLKLYIVNRTVIVLKKISKL